MLSTLEVDGLRQGDTFDLAIEPIVEALESEARDPYACRAVGQTFLNVVARHGLYRVACNPADYLSLCTSRRQPYGQWIIPDWPDNWEGNSMLNLHPDTLLAVVEQAVDQGYGVCWEGDIGERGFSFDEGMAVTLLPPFLLRCKAILCPPSDDHCMAIVGRVRADDGSRYYVLKNSWGPANPYGGYMLVTPDYLRWNTVAVCLARDAVAPRQIAVAIQ